MKAGQCSTVNTRYIVSYKTLKYAAKCVSVYTVYIVKSTHINNY